MADRPATSVVGAGAVGTWSSRSASASPRVAAVWTDVDARTRSRNEQAALAAANTHLAALRHEVAVTQFAKAVTTAKRNSLQTSIASTMSQLAATNGALANANVNAYVQGVGIDTLQTCLGGVKSAFSQITAKNNARSRQGHLGRLGPVHAIGRRHRAPVWSTPSTSPTLRSSWWARRTSPTPPTRWPATSRSSTPPTSCTGRAVGNALPSLPAWATPNYTWAPAVAMVGGTFVLYYAVNVAGTGERVHLGGDVQPTPGAVPRQVDGTAGVPEFAGRLHRPGVVHRHQRNALSGVEVGRPGLVEDLVAAARPVRHVVRPRKQPHLAARSRPAMGGRDCRSAGHGHHGRALLPLLSPATTGTARTTRLASPPARGLSVRAATPHRIRFCRAAPALPGPAASRCSPIRQGTSGSRSTPGSQARSDSPTAETSTSAISRSPAWCQRWQRG